MLLAKNYVLLIIIIIIAATTRITTMHVLSHHMTVDRTIMCLCLPPVPEPIVIPPPFNCPLVEPSPRCDVCIDLQSKGYGESTMSPAPPPKQGSRAVP